MQKARDSFPASAWKRLLRKPLLDHLLLPSNLSVIWKVARWREGQCSMGDNRAMMQHRPNADAREPQGRSSTVTPGKNILEREGPFALESISEHACRVGNVMYVNRGGEMV